MVRIHPDHHFGAVAQLGEHLLCKQGVVGSIPSSSNQFGNRRPASENRAQSAEVNANVYFWSLDRLPRIRLFFNKRKK